MLSHLVFQSKFNIICMAGVLHTCKVVECDLSFADLETYVPCIHISNAIKYKTHFLPRSWVCWFDFQSRVQTNVGQLLYL